MDDGAWAIKDGLKTSRDEEVYAYVTSSAAQPSDIKLPWSVPDNDHGFVEDARGGVFVGEVAPRGTPPVEQKALPAPAAAAAVAPAVASSLPVTRDVSRPVLAQQSSPANLNAIGAAGRAAASPSAIKAVKQDEESSSGSEEELRSFLQSIGVSKVNEPRTQDKEDGRQQHFYPIHIASLQANDAMVRLLIQHRADVNNADHAGMTAVDVARRVNTAKRDGQSGEPGSHEAVLRALQEVAEKSVNEHGTGGP